uniref:Transposase n=1 Tax=Strongyloides venezuelensis TaxID=75913 RepID=A0A0K0G3A3_STRVS
MKSLSIDHLTTTVNIHRSNGRAERIIGFLRQALRSNKHDDQDNLLQIAIYVFNNTPQTKTNIILAQLIGCNTSRLQRIPYYNQNLTGEQELLIKRIRKYENKQGIEEIHERIIQPNTIVWLKSTSTKTTDV